MLEQLNYRFNPDSLLHHLRGYTSNRWGLEFQMRLLEPRRVNNGRDPRHEYNACVQVCPTHSGFDDWVEQDLAPRVVQILDDRTQRLAGLNGTKVHIAGDRIEFR